MLEKIDLSIAQPAFSTLSFKDVTPFGAGGWDNGAGGDYPIMDCQGWTLDLEHHELGDMGQIQRTLALKANLYDQANNVLATEWPDVDIDQYPDGLYIVKYNPGADDASPLLVEPYQKIFLVVSKLRVEVAKACIRYVGVTKENDKFLLKEKINEFLLELECCKSLVLIDNYTGAVKSFSKLNRVVTEIKSIM